MYEQVANKRFYGKTKQQMKSVMYFLCDIQDEIEMNDAEEEMFTTAIQCVADIINRMEDEPERGDLIC